MPTTTPEPLLTEAALAERWSVARRTLANRRAQGLAPAYVKVNGGTVRYRLSDVEACEQRVEPVASEQ